MDKILKQYEQVDVKNKIKENIKKNRMGNFKLKILGLDKDKSYRINIKQTRHKFKFGCNGFLLGEFENEDKNKIYKEKFAKLFNITTLPFYWNSLEPEQGKCRFNVDCPKIYRRPAIDLLMEFCKEKGIEPKLHCLNYEPFIPEWAKNLSFDEYKKALEKRFEIIAKRYAKVIPDVEVMNEIFQNDKSWETTLRKDVEWSFRTAKKYFKNNRLIINEGQNVYNDALNDNWQYYELVKSNLDKGVPIEGVGFQAHMMWCDKKCASPYAFWKFFEKYEQLGLPLSITEVTVPTRIDGVVDENIQAELIKNLYSLWFGIEKIDTIIYWDFVDGYSHKSIMGDLTSLNNVRRGGLLNFDCSNKLSYKILDDLINKQWKTSFTTRISGGDIIEFNGFYGEYEIVIESENEKIKKKIDLNKTSEFSLTKVL